MWLLSASILLFIVVIGLIVYANWPASGTSCGGGCGGCPSCQQRPCDRCQKPRSRCGCPPPSGGCPFC